MDILKPQILATANFSLRVSLVVGVVGIAAILTEMPYILMLKSREGEARGWAYTAENIGTFAGVLLGTLSQVYFGFNGSMAGAVGCYLLALVVIKIRGPRIAV
ncbi:MAG: hypothetical protein HC883_04405 [Bdellovibrionaceae bacterium]|nr:hypothetical protein [Pseudobdellovibrionaceae bacterium]